MTSTPERCPHCDGWACNDECVPKWTEQERDLRETVLRLEQERARLAAALAKALAVFG